MTKPKRIPYALTNFERIRTENYLYVDKTRFIETLENEDTQYQFLIRPRKFGKSLFLSVLEHYYDIRFKTRFEELFGDLYIGQNPTPKANTYFVMNFNFSGLDSSDVESFKISFTEKIRNNIEMFFSLHRAIFKNTDDLIHEDKNFFSLLFYMGLVTIDNSNPLKMALKIPNYSVKTIYWEFIERMLTEELEGLSLDNSKYIDPIYSLAYKDDYQPFFDYFSQNIVKYLSNRDLQHTVEKEMKYLLLPIFFNSHYYFPFSELENSEGYSDIYLKRGHLHPGSVSEWVWELKYIKQSDAENEKLLLAKQTQAIEQLKRYKSSNFFKDRTDVRYLAVVFVGKKGYSVKEVF